MQQVWNAIKTGAEAYLGKQARTIIPLIVILTVALFLSVYVVPPSIEAKEHFAGFSDSQVTMIVAIGRAVAFVMGALFSLTVGQLGMRMAVQANVRVAAEARKSFGGALRIAYRAGTITGMLTDGLGLFGGTMIFIIFGKAAPDALLGFGFGGTLLALFMRVGGGIFTKAADVGADLVGKVEQSLEEDDTRNAAVIADLVGDNVGDCAGMAADIFESYEVTIVSGLDSGPRNCRDYRHGAVDRLPAGGARHRRAEFDHRHLSRQGHQQTPRAVRCRPSTAAFTRRAAFSMVAFALYTMAYMRTASGGVEWRPLLSVGVGVALAIVIDRITEYFTDTHFTPVKNIAKATSGGPATHDSVRHGGRQGERGVGHARDCRRRF